VRPAPPDMEQSFDGESINEGGREVPQLLKNLRNSH